MRKDWYFLLGALLLCLAIAIFNPQKAIESLEFFISVIIKIIPIFILIFILLVLVDYLVKPKSIVKHLGRKAGLKGWLYSIIGGIISAGPIYMWYPLLKDIREKGGRYAFIAAFLYNRAIKIPLLPLFIYYFGLKFATILFFWMLVFSVIQGMIVERFMEVKI